MNIKERLEGLKKEREIIKSLEYLSFDCVDTCTEWYDHEIQWCEERLRESEKNGI